MSATGALRPSEMRFDAKMALDFHHEPSGGQGMPDPPPEADDEDDRVYPESPFLIALWDELEQAYDKSTRNGALDLLDEVARHCEDAVALIRRWQAGVF
jgi:hypothetical protein